MGIAFSIAGVDTERGWIGAAGGVCTNEDGAPFVVNGAYKIVPEKALLVVNALFLEVDSFPLLRAQQEMGKGTNPSTILAAITDPAVDEDFQKRQYGLVDFQGRVAGYTGADVGTPKLNTQGTFPDFAYTAQGQMLYGQDTITGMESAFQNNGDCDDLVDRLHRAIQTVSQDNKGHKAENCPQGAEVVFLRVDRSNGDKVLELVVDYVPGQDPFQKLQQDYEAWRAENPCGSFPDDDASECNFLTLIPQLLFGWLLYILFGISICAI